MKRRLISTFPEVNRPSRGGRIWVKLQDAYLKTAKLEKQIKNNFKKLMKICQLIISRLIERGDCPNSNENHKRTKNMYSRNSAWAAILRISELYNGAPSDSLRAAKYTSHPCFKGKPPVVVKI